MLHHIFLYVPLVSVNLTLFWSLPTIASSCAFLCGNLVPTSIPFPFKKKSFLKLINHSLLRLGSINISSKSSSEQNGFIHSVCLLYITFIGIIYFMEFEHCPVKPLGLQIEGSLLCKWVVIRGIHMALWSLLSMCGIHFAQTFHFHKLLVRIR
jgi:hypothetical protein